MAHADTHKYIPFCYVPVYIYMQEEIYRKLKKGKKELKIYYSCLLFAVL